jgi:hypothetical protein
VSVPVRELVVVFACTEKLTCPLPVPPLPAVIVIQLALLAAVQEQPLVVWTLAVPVPPLAASEMLRGETL